MRKGPIYWDDKESDDYSSYSDSADWKRTTTVTNEMVTRCQCYVCQLKES